MANKVVPSFELCLLCGVNYDTPATSYNISSMKGAIVNIQFEREQLQGAAHRDGSRKVFLNKSALKGEAYRFSAQSGSSLYRKMHMKILLTVERLMDLGCMKGIYIK